MRADTHGRWAHTPIASQHNICDLEKLSQFFLVLLTGFEPRDLWNLTPTFYQMNHSVTTTILIMITIAIVVTCILLRLVIQPTRPITMEVKISFILAKVRVRSLIFAKVRVRSVIFAKVRVRSVIFTKVRVRFSS